VGRTLSAAIGATVVLARGALSATVGRTFGPAVRATVVLAGDALGASVRDSFTLSHASSFIEGVGSARTGRLPISGRCLAIHHASHPGANPTVGRPGSGRVVAFYRSSGW